MKTPIIVVALLFFGFIFAYFFVWPKFGSWRASQAKLTSLKNELTLLDQKKNLINALEAAEPTLSEQSQTAQILIPIEESRESFSAALDALASASGVRLTTVNFDNNAITTGDTALGKTMKSSNTKGLTYAAVVVGSYASLGQFLLTLPSLSRLTTLSRFQVTQDTSNNDPANQNVSFNFTGTIYTKAAPKVDDKLSFSPKAWQYLSDRAKPAARALEVTSPGRANPFAVLLPSQ